MFGSRVRQPSGAQAESAKIRVLGAPDQFRKVDPECFAQHRQIVGGDFSSAGFQGSDGLSGPAKPFRQVLLVPASAASLAAYVRGNHVPDGGHGPMVQGSVAQDIPPLA
jgi:hypothetical protein